VDDFISKLSKPQRRTLVKLLRQIVQLKNEVDGGVEAVEPRLASPRSALHPANFCACGLPPDKDDPSKTKWEDTAFDRDPDDCGEIGW